MFGFSLIDFPFYLSSVNDFEGSATFTIVHLAHLNEFLLSFLRLHGNGPNDVVPYRFTPALKVLCYKCLLLLSLNSCLEKMYYYY